MTNYYQLDDYTKILFDGLHIKLSPDILKKIDDLTEEINKISVQMSNTPTFNSQKPVDKYKKTSSQTSSSMNYSKRMKTTKSDSDWQNIRTPFKATFMEKKEGIEKSINDIRICLNKISNKNYDVQRDNILELLKIIVDKEVDPEESDDESDDTNEQEDIKKIATAIFDIASNNKFFSEIYADLYRDLIAKYEVFIEIIDSFIEKYKESIHDIHYVDPNLEYNKFCEYNKKNDNRKALSTFITNLMKKNIINKNIIIDIILKFQELVFNYIDTPNKLNEVEEITENIFILITTSHKYCNEVEEWKQVLDNILKCSQFKVKDKASISSRAIFKYMDMLDTIKKCI
jgi:hypothetical protein